MCKKEMIAPGVKPRVLIFSYIDPIFSRQKNIVIHVKISETFVPESSL